MIHDVKVFNPKGELTGIINAQRLHDAKYLEIAGSISKTVWGKSAKKQKTRIKCAVCKKKVFGKVNQATCGSNKCIYLRGLLKKSPKAFRIFNCTECNIKVETYHHNKKTCGSDKCFKANRERSEKLRIQKLEEKKHGFQKNGK